MDRVTGTPKKVTLADKLRLFSISLREKRTALDGGFLRLLFLQYGFGFPVSVSSGLSQAAELARDGQCGN